MKNSFLLIAFLLTNCLSFSQSLIPDKVIVSPPDTLFCWIQPKCKIIAGKIIRLSYCDSISHIQQDKITALTKANEVQKDFIDVLSLQKKNLDNSLVLKDKDIGNLTLVNNSQKKDISRQKGLKWLGFGLAGLFGALAIIY